MSPDARRATRPLRRRVPPLSVRRTSDLIGPRMAPALVAAVIVEAYSSSLTFGALVFALSLSISSLSRRTGFPAALLPAASTTLSIAAPVAGIALAAVLGAISNDPLPPSGIGYAVAGAWTALALGASAHTAIERLVRVRVAVIGAQPFAEDLASEFEAVGVPGYEVVGWIGGRTQASGGRLERLGSLRELRRIVLGRQIDLLVYAPGDDPEEPEGRTVFDAVATFCLDLPVRMIGANQLYEALLGHVPVGTIDGAWYGYIMHPSFRPTPRLPKRCFDLAVATVIGVAFLPVLLLAALAIKLTDGGPALYRQRRVGAHGVEFEILKLRTMRVDAEADGAPRWCAPGDDRVTAVGRLLRRTHIDELPQLWNVIRGEMTMVGPRPERPELVAEIERQFRHYGRRHLVKPGITGWAQLRCGYAGSHLGTAWKLCHDLYYVKHSSLLGDSLILFETALVTFRDAHRSLRSPAKRFLVGEEARG
ncbi:MAG TPA: exopolysaccharide biosynthesis polyprenyl glycosylphosphotransferase [Solirubrobacterales bacterium]